MVVEGGSNSSDTATFHLFIGKQKIANTIFLSVRSKNEGIELSEAILLVVAWLKKAREYVQKPIDELNFFNPDEFNKK